MSRLVLDCSISAAWLFEDQTSALAEHVLGSLATLDGPLGQAASKAGVALVSAAG